jgi:hypothetical protein
MCESPNEIKEPAFKTYDDITDVVYQWTIYFNESADALP